MSNIEIMPYIPYKIYHTFYIPFDIKTKWLILLTSILITDVHRPCNDMVTILGMPKYYRPESGTAGTARLYINNIVKVTEDFISYDLLR